MYKFNQKCISRKTKEYSKMEMKSSLEMYQLVEPFISNDIPTRMWRLFCSL